MKAIVLACAGLVGWAAGTGFAQELPPELAEPAAKYKAAAEALEKGRLAAAAQAAQPYASALDEVKKAATAKGDVKTSEAATKEREAALAGKLGPELPAGLPALRLQGTRKALLMKLEPVNADFGKRKKRLDGEYLGFLDSLAQKADPESALAKRIAAEKKDVLTAEKADNGKSEEDKNDAKVARGKNVVVNGDFEKLDADGKPEGWKSVQNVTVESENNNSFVRFSEPARNRDGTMEGVSIIQKDFNIPKSAKYVALSGRLRVKGNVPPPGAKNPLKPKIALGFKDQKGAGFSWVVASWCGKSGVWKTLSAEGPIPEKAVSFDVGLERGCFSGQIDFDDIEVTFQ